jgi:chorismate-pyruvate lyase
MLPVVSNYLRKPDGAYDKLIKASQTLLEAQKEKLKRGLEVYQRLVKLYGGDRVKVEAMLSFVPIRRWGGGGEDS